RRQDRAALYDLARDHSPPLVARSDVVAVAERTGPEGVLEPLGEDEIARVVATVRALRPPPEALAVALLFAFRHAEHERRLVAAVGLQDLLTLDMGGTSADASLVTGGTPLGDGGGTVAGLALALPAVLIETVSAGGGSIARVDEGGALKVGPESAGAIPGPA